MRVRAVALLALAVMPSSFAFASDVVEVAPLTDQVILIHLNDGHVVHHLKGQKRSDETVISDPLDVVKAGQSQSYSLSGLGAPAISAVYRKSKGTDFAWFVDRWLGDHAENDRPDHTNEHWIYLQLATRLVPGEVYELNSGTLARNGTTWKVALGNRSEAIHTNLLGYVPTVNAKYAYLYQWMGDGGSLDIKPYVGRRFQVLDDKTHQAVFEGKVTFRASATNVETHQPNDTPNGNFSGCDVAQCDFSPLTRPGRYVVSIYGVGNSFPFSISADVYRSAFITTARGLYHNRSGIALTRPYTEYVRPAPHNPLKTPGFQGKLQYSTLRVIDYTDESSSKEALTPTLKGPLNVWGWYQDAGDWDSYPSHLRVPIELLLAYRMAPSHFADKELNIPESGNGIADIVDEAAWLPRFCYRLRHELLAKHWGTGGIGLRVDGDAFGGDTGPKDIGIGSWEDVDRTWIVSGEDPLSTYGYAGVAAQLAMVIRRDPDKIGWAREAKESYRWAQENTRAGDDAKIRMNRLYASASLFRLTGEKRYEDLFEKDFTALGPHPECWMDLFDPLAAYLLPGGTAKPAPDLYAKVRSAALRVADASVESANQRSMRWGGNSSMPMLIGQQTTPWALELAVGYTLTGDRKYLDAAATTCDYFLGTNSLNMTWVTGLGPRHPLHVFHLDAWYNGKPEAHPGIIPYGPWLKSRNTGVGPWDHDWANKTVYPPIDQWPGNERWFDSRCSPMTNEFTIHQNIAPAAAIFGFLCGPASSSTGSHKR